MNTGTIFLHLVPPGFRGFPRDFWAVVLVIFMSFIGLGVILPVRILYAQQVGLTMFEIGIMGSAFFFSQFIFQVPIGYLGDRIGRKWTLLGGLLIQGLAAWVYLVRDEPWVFIGMRFVEGIGASAQQPAARALIADVVPSDRRGRAYGIYRASFQGGMLAGPAIGGLLAGFGGYEIAYYINGLSRLLSVLLVMLFVHETRRPAWRQAAGAAVDRAAVGFRALFTPPLVAAYIVGLGVTVTAGLDSSVWSIYLVDIGAGLTFVGLSYTVRAAAALLLTPVGGSLADRYNRPTLILASGLLLAATCLALALVRDLKAILLISVVQGVASALALPAVDRWVADYSPAAARARVQAVFQSCHGISAGVIALAAGPLYQLAPAWPFAMSAVVILATVVGGALVMLMVGPGSAGARERGGERAREREPLPTNP